MGGECIDENYVAGTKYYLKWKCSKGHIWNAPPHRIRNKHWCPYCAGQKTSIEDLREYAKEHGGECLSTNYEHNKKGQKIKFRCSDGHIFEKTKTQITSEQWCPYCNGFVQEEKCRFIIESLTGLKFIKTKKF
jgi:hypothetical protein